MFGYGKHSSPSSKNVSLSFVRLKRYQCIEEKEQSRLNLFFNLSSNLHEAVLTVKRNLATTEKAYTVTELPFTPKLKLQSSICYLQLRTHHFTIKYMPQYGKISAASTAG
jgi:hypothetical protein